MEQKFFMHRIKHEDGIFTRGIEVHDTLDAAILSFHSYMGLWAYNNPEKPNVKMVSCKITDISGNALEPYNKTWTREPEVEEEPVVKSFLHYIRKDGNAFTKNIDEFNNIEDAIRMFHNYMAYGYGSAQHPNVKYVSCEITDMGGSVSMNETWIAPENEEPAEA